MSDRLRAVVREAVHNHAPASKRYESGRVIKRCRCGYEVDVTTGLDRRSEHLTDVIVTALVRAGVTL